MHLDSWSWTRWQLVHVERDDDDVVFDAVELSDEPAAPIRLMTLTLSDGSSSAPAPGHGDVVGRQLQRWLDAQNGVCEAFYRDTAPYGSLVLFQGRDSIVFATDAEPFA